MTLRVNIQRFQRNAAYDIGLQMLRGSTAQGHIAPHARKRAAELKNLLANQMSKNPRDGPKLPLGYEVARDIERIPVIAQGVSNAAVRAVSSVLYQRLQD